MIGDDLQELYKLLRGSRSATSVLDARALAQENKFVAAHTKLIDARESYMESRSRLLKQDPETQFKGNSKEDKHNRKVLARKQEKTHEILKAFEELMPQLERLAKREQSQAAAEAEVIAKVEDDIESVVDDPEADLEADPADDGPVFMLATPSDITERFVSTYAASSDDEQLDLINGSFGFREIVSDDDIFPNAIYYIRSSGKSFLVSTPLTAIQDESIQVTSVVDQKSVRPFTRDEFIRLGTRRRMVLLTKTVLVDEPSSFDDRDVDGDVDGDQNVLDMGTFGQLMSAAQRSGLVSGADQIGHVRDREFRLGKYDLAFQTIDAIYSRFTAEASQRAGQLTREDADISAGRIKISPKDLQAKRTRDRIQTQEIERARRRFQVVLEGLRRLTAGVS